MFIFFLLNISANHKNKKVNLMKSKKQKKSARLVYLAIGGVIILSLTVWFLNTRAKNLEQEQKAQSYKLLEEATNFPVDKLQLKNTQWKANVFQTDIVNKGDKPTYNIQITFKMSKTKEVWKIDEDFNFTVPYKIDPGQTITIKETAVSTKVNPWTTAWILSAKYYNGEVVPTLPPVVVKQVPKTIQQTDTTQWGVAKQIDAHTWTTKLGQDSVIGTPSEIFDALNVYRNRLGKGTLTWDSNLAAYAQTRATLYNSIKALDEHKGFIDYTNSTDNLRTLGFWGVGENACYGYRLLGVHIIEWVFAGDKPHDDNQLDSSWTHVGIGVSGLGVDIIFGKEKM
jgi:uncharacterized protein YkwD